MLEPRPVLGIEPRFVDKGELAHERDNRKVRQARPVQNKGADLVIQVLEEQGGPVAANRGIEFGISAAVFGAVQIVLERAITAFDPSPALGLHG